MFNGYHETPSTSYNDLELERGKKNQNCSKWPYGNGNVMQWTHLHSQNHQTEIWPPKTAFLGIPNAVNSTSKCSCSGCFQMPENQNYQGDLPWHTSWFSRSLPVPLNSSHDQVKLQGNYHWENASLLNETSQYGGESFGAQYTQENGDKSFFYKSHAQARLSDIYQSEMMQTMKTCKNSKKEDLIKQEGIMSNATSPEIIQHDPNIGRANPTYEPLRGASERKRIEEGSDCYNQNQKFLNMESCRQPNGPSSYHLHSNNARHAISGAFLKSVPSNVNQNRVPSVGNRNIKENLCHSVNDVGKVTSYNANHSVAEEKHCMSLYQVEITKEPNTIQDNIRSGHINPFSLAPDSYHNLNVNRDLSPSLSEKDTQKFVNGRNSQYFSKNNFSDMMKNNGQNLILDSRKDYNFGGRKCEMNPTHINSAKTIHTSPKTTEYSNSKYPDFKKYNTKDCSISEKSSIPDMKIVINPYTKELIDLQSGNGMVRDETVNVDVHNNIRRSQFEFNEALLSDKGYNSLQRNLNPFKDYRRPEYSYVHRGIQGPYEYLNGMINLSRNDIPINVNQNGVANIQHSEYHNGLDAYSRLNYNHSYDDTFNQFEKIHYQLSDEGTSQTIPPSTVLFPPQSSQNSCAKLDRFKHTEKGSQFTDKISHLESIGYEKVCKNGTTKISPLRLLRKKKFVQKSENVAETNASETSLNPKNVTPPLDVRRFWATWAEEEDENVSQTQMVVLDCHNIDPEQAELLHLYEAESVRSSQENGANALGFKTQSLDKNVYDQDVTVYVRNEINHVNIDKVKDNVKASDLMKIDKINENLEKAHHSAVHNSLRDLEGFENVSDKNYVKSISTSETLMEISTDPDSVKKTDSVIEIKLSSTERESSSGISKDMETNRIKKHEEESEMDKHGTSNFTEKKEISVEKNGEKCKLSNKVSSENSSDNNSLFEEFKNENCESDIAEVNINKKSVFRSNLMKMGVTDILTNHERNDENSTNCKMEINREFSVSPNSSDDCESNNMPVLPDLPTSEYRKNKFLDYYDSNFCNSSSPPLINESVSKSCPNNNTSINQEPNEIEERLCENTKVNDSNELFYNISENAAKSPTSEVKFEKKNYNQDRNEIVLKSSERSHGSMEVGEVLKKLSEISFEAKNDNLEITENSKVKNSVLMEKYKTEKKKLIYKKERKSKKLHHREKSSRIDEFTFQNLSPSRPSVQFSIQKSHDLKISFRVLNNAKIYEEDNPSSYENGHKGEDVEREGNNRIDVNERRTLFAEKLKDLPEFDEHERNEKDGKDLVRRKKKELKKRKTQSDRLSISKNPFFKIKRSRYITAEGCSGIVQKSESFNGTLDDLWKNCENDSISNDGFQVHETVDSAKIKLTFKRHKKNMENKKNFLSNDEVTEAKNKFVGDSTVSCFGSGNFDKSKGNPTDFEDADPEPNVEDVSDEINISHISKIKNEEIMNFDVDDECFTQKIENCEDSKPITHLSSIIIEKPISGDFLKVSEPSAQKNKVDNIDSANIDKTLVSISKTTSPEDSANFNETCLKTNEVVLSSSYTELEPSKRISDNKMREGEKGKQENPNNQNSNFYDSIDKSSFSEANDEVKFLNENITNNNHKLEVSNIIYDGLDNQIIDKEETNYTEKRVLNKVDEAKQVFKKFDDLIKDEKMEIDENFELKKIEQVIKSTNNEVLCVLETNSKSLITNSDCNSIYNIKAEELTSAGSYSQNEEPSEKLPEEDTAKSDFQEFNLEIKSSTPQIDSNLNKSPTIEDETFNEGNTFNKYAESKSGNTDCIKYIETDTAYKIVEEKCINTAEDIKFTTFNCDYNTFPCESLNENVEKCADDQPLNELAIEDINQTITFNNKPDFEFNIISPDIHSKKDNEKCSDESIEENNCNSIEIQEVIVQTFRNKITNNESVAELKNGSYDVVIMDENQSRLYEDHAGEKTEFIDTVEENKYMNEGKNNNILDNIGYDNGLVTENDGNNKSTPQLNFTVEKFAKFSELIDKDSVLSSSRNFESIKINSEETEITSNSHVMNNNINSAQTEKVAPVSNHRFIASTISKEIISFPEYHFLVSKNLYSYAKENVSMEKKTNYVTRKLFPKIERKIFRRFSSESTIRSSEQLGVIVKQKNVFSSTRSRSKSLTLDFISFTLDKKEVEKYKTEEIIQSNIPVCDIPLPPGNPPLENCFNLEQYLKNRLSNEKIFAENENKEKKNDLEISPLPRAIEHCILKSQKERFSTTKALNCENCQSPFLHSGSVKFRNPSPPLEETSIMKNGSLSCQTVDTGKASLRNPSPPFDKDRFHLTDRTNTKELLAEETENSARDFSAPEFSSLLEENIKSPSEVSKTRQFQCFSDIAQKTQAQEEEFVSDKLDDLYIKCFAIENSESKVAEEGRSEDIKKNIETVKKIDSKEESSKSFAFVCDMDKLNSSAECYNENLNRFAPDTYTTEDLNFVDYSEINHQIMNVKENEVIMSEESILKTDQFYECEKHALYESLAISDDIEVEKVSDDDKFLNVMQNCLENAKKFLNIGNLKPFSYSVDDLLEIDYRTAETCPSEAELDNSNHVSKDVLLSSFEGNPSEELVVEGNIQPVEISLDIMPSFCPDAESNLCSEILPVNNWPYLEEEVSSSPMRNISDETDLLSSCIENDLLTENSKKSLSESENIRRSYSNKQSTFCRNMQDSQLYTQRKSRRVSLSVAESSTFLREKQQRENMGLSVNGHSKFVLQRRRTVEGLLDGKKIHSKTHGVKETDEKIPNANSKDFEKLSFLLKDLKCRLDIERLSLKKDIINDNKLTKKSVHLDVFRRKLDEGEPCAAKNDNSAKEKEKLVYDKDVKVCSSHRSKRISKDDEEVIDKKKIKTRTNYKSSAWQPKVVLFRISKNVIKTFSMRPRIKNDPSSRKIDSPRSSEKLQNYSFKTSPIFTAEKRSSERDGSLGRKEDEIFGDVGDQISQDTGKFAMLEKSGDNFGTNIAENTNNKKRKKQRFRNLHPKKKLVPETFNKTKENRLTAQNSSKPVNSESDSDFTSPEYDLPKEILRSQLKSTKSSCSTSQNFNEHSTKDDNMSSVEHLVSNKSFKEHQIRSRDNSKPKMSSKYSGSSDKKKEYNDNNNYYVDNYNKNHKNKKSDCHIYSCSSTFKNSGMCKKKECSDGHKECRKESKRKRDEEEFSREVDAYRKEENHLKDGERRLSALENRSGQNDPKKVSREANDHYHGDKQRCKEWKNPEVSSKNSNSKSKNSKSKSDSMKKRFWVCEVCGFSKSSERVIHIQSHPFHCQSCHLAFKTEGNFLEHLTRKHKDIRNQHHCLLCELSFDLEKEYYQHLQSREHRHLESVEKNTINTLFTLLTGHPCPVLGPVESKSEWLPSQAGTVHFYHQATPLSLALQYLKLHHDKRTFSNPTLTPQSE